MSVKGSWTRVQDSDKYEFHKSLIFMDTRDMADFLGFRFKSYADSGEGLDEAREKLYREFADIAYDVSCIVDTKCEAAREIRRKLINIHEALYEIERSQ